jgi:Spy/CpxP family protein refolding chaperone
VKRLVLGAVLALSLAANAAVLVMSLRAQAASPMGIPLFSRVSVDAAQRGRILTLREDFLAFRAANYARTDALRGELAELLKTDAPDRARIDAVLARIAESQAALQRRVVEQALSVRAVLRPEQRPAFEELMSQQLRAGVPMQRAGGQDECPMGSKR